MIRNLAYRSHHRSVDAFDAFIGIDTHYDVHVTVALATNGAKLDEYRILKAI